MNAQKMILPGLVLGILGIIGISTFLSTAPAGITRTPGLWPGCTLSAAYPDSILQWCDLIQRYANENGVDSNLVAAVMLQESGGRPDAYSKSGAVGLLQVMPRNGKAASYLCKNGPCFTERPAMNDLFDPEYNVSYGVQMLAALIHQHGNIREALRAYGPEDAGYYYADQVISIMNSHQ